MTSFTQESIDQEKEVKLVINQFFDALKNQDTVLLKKVCLVEGQIWVVNQTKSPSQSYMRFIKDDLNAFDPKTQLLETPKSFDIKIQKDLATAWVPYTFHVNHKFSHCGVDIFTLIRKNKQWRIANITYTIETEGCDK